MSDKNIRYGNDHFWCFIEDGWANKEIAIWEGPVDNGQVIARVMNSYEAKRIIDALLNYVYIEDKNKFSKQELTFLEFGKSNFKEPYATMASNAILWNDKETYNKLKSEFSVIYS